MSGLIIQSQRHHPRRPRAGMSFVYVVVMFILLIGFVAFAVDLGRMRLARAQLSTATDASARAGAWQLPKHVDPKDRDAIVRQAAIDCAGKNTCLGTAIAVNSSNDIEL